MSKIELEAHLTQALQSAGIQADSSGQIPLHMLSALTESLRQDLKWKAVPFALTILLTYGALIERTNLVAKHVLAPTDVWASPEDERIEKWTNLQKLLSDFVVNTKSKVECWDFITVEYATGSLPLRITIMQNLFASLENAGELEQTDMALLRQFLPELSFPADMDEQTVFEELSHFAKDYYGTEPVENAAQIDSVPLVFLVACAIAYNTSVTR